MAARHPDLLAFLDAEPNIEYVVAMAKNAVLKRKAKPPTLCPRTGRRVIAKRTFAACLGSCAAHSRRRGSPGWTSGTDRSKSPRADLPVFFATA